jgi:gamma-glutamyl:cysteine ligase YbdK (ATP-grasp superfamily)
MIFCCYYRPHVSTPNIRKLRIILDYVSNKYPDHSLTVAGDVNLPEIDWEKMCLKEEARYKRIHYDFLSMKTQCNN